MRTHLRWTVFFVVTVALFGISLLSSAPLRAQDKSLVWERFDVDIGVNADGTFNVAEHQDIRFTSGSFTFGYREIPILNLDYIDDWEITDSSGNTYHRASSGGEPYTFTVDESGDDYVIRWYFPPIANGSETYTLRYRVHGGLRFYEGGDQVWWKAIYGDRSFPVLNGRVRVVVPDVARIQEWAAYINGADARDSATAQLMENGQVVIYELTRRLEAGEEFEVRVEFTPGIVDGTTPGWQARADAIVAEREAEMAYRQKWGPIAALVFGLLGLLLAGGGSAALYALWYRFGRDRPVELVADYLPEPPDTLPPGMAGTLLDETVDMEDVLATLD